MIRGASNGDVVLDVRDLRTSIGGAKVLDGVSFTLVDRVREGTITGQIASVLGPSGVGKTRLLRALAGLDVIDGGAVFGAAHRPLDPRDVGLVFQDYPLLDHRTVLGNLELAGAIHGLGRERRARAMELLKIVGLEGQEDRYPSELSGGQRQRAAIAQQVMVPRKLLLLDEPWSGLDPRAMASVTKLVVDVANLRQDNTVLIVTHDVRAAIAVSDTIVILGKARRDGGAEVKATYDLVELGIAWGSSEGPMTAATLEEEIRARFEDL